MHQKTSKFGINRIYNYILESAPMIKGSDPRNSKRSNLTTGKFQDMQWGTDYGDKKAKFLILCGPNSNPNLK